jgi:hypothetical protein
MICNFDRSASLLGINSSVVYCWEVEGGDRDSESEARSPQKKSQTQHPSAVCCLLVRGERCVRSVRMRWFLLFLFALAEALETNKLSETWPLRSKYYEPDLETTLAGILELNPACKASATVLPPGDIRVPPSGHEIFITEISVKKEIYEFWRQMERAQARADLTVCNPPADKVPFLNHTGCRHFGYQHRHAPRCQQDYLREICESSSRPIFEKSVPQFVPAEADHSHVASPPQPWLLTARNALVSRCGVISYGCGFAHSSASCSFDLARRSTCPLSSLDKVRERRATTSVCD